MKFIFATAGVWQGGDVPGPSDQNRLGKAQRHRQRGQGRAPRQGGGLRQGGAGQRPRQGRQGRPWPRAPKPRHDQGRMGRSHGGLAIHLFVGRSGEATNVQSTRDTFDKHLIVQHFLVLVFVAMNPSPREFTQQLKKSGGLIDEPKTFPLLRYSNHLNCIVQIL